MYNSINFSYYFEEKFYLFIATTQNYSPTAIGIALPGHYNQMEKNISTNNAFWKKFKFDALIDTLTISIYFENNVQCLILSERLFGKNSHDRNFAILHVGRGMFCSCIYDGSLYGKNSNLVGEIGHVIKYLAITINNLSLMLDTTRIILHGELFTEPQLSLLMTDLLNKNNILLSTELPLTVEVKNYADINGVVAACGLCVTKHLLTH